jgi:hypothetical protein
MRERGLNRPKIRSEREHPKVPFLFHFAYFMGRFLPVFLGNKKALAGVGKGFFDGAQLGACYSKVSGPNWIRTNDRLLRRQLLYPTELWGQIRLKLKVGVAGFEPTTSWSQTRRDTGLRYTPKNKKKWQAILHSSPSSSRRNKRRSSWQPILRK